MKKRVESAAFQSYTIANVPDLEKTTLKDFLEQILGLETFESTQIQCNTNRRLLAHVAYGLSALKIGGYDARANDSVFPQEVSEEAGLLQYENTASVTDIVVAIRCRYLNAHNYNSVFACNYFLDHFLQATKKQYKTSTDHHSKATSFNIMGLFDTSHTVTNRKKGDMITALAHDIRLYNALSLLHMETPIPERNALANIFHKLRDFIINHILSTKNHIDLTANKIYIYIKLATKLMDNHPFPDLHGAGIIVSALNFIPKELLHTALIRNKEKNKAWAALNHCFAPAKNFSALRQHMKQVAVPALWLIIKDLDAALGNPKMMRRLELAGTIYFEIANKRSLILKETKFLKKDFKTNMISMLELDNSPCVLEVLM